MPPCETEAQVGRMARAMYLGNHPSGNPDALTPAPRGQIGMMPKWRLYEPLATYALGALERTYGIDDFQSDATNLIVEIFGQEVQDDKLDRVDRFVEEALEMAQAAYNGLVSPDVAQKRIAFLQIEVFSRPVGEKSQEAGGVMTTLASLCRANGVSLAKAAADEVNRARKNIDIIRVKQRRKEMSCLPFA